MKRPSAEGPTTVFINGKFAAQRTTGVQRVAGQMVHALDGLVQGHWVLLCPPGAVAPVLQHIEVRTVGPAWLPLLAWEQVLLPWAVGRRRLVNLTGAAPALLRRQLCMLHDAAVFDTPANYGWRFVAWYRWLFGRLARSAHCLVTVSAFSQQRLAIHLAIPCERIAVVPNGADHLQDVEADATVLDRLGLRGTPFLLAVGDAGPNKNIARLVTAMARLPAGGPRLVIAGGRNARVFASGAATDPPWVVRAGAVGDAELKALYGSAVALVFPSLYEGFGLPPLEAMACGCPVAASAAASLPEVCGHAALLFDAASDADFDRVLHALLHDVALRERLRADGLQRASGYTWSRAAGGLLSRMQEELPA